MSGLVCAFTGHREIPSDEYEKIRVFTKKTVDLLISRGVTEFISGGAVGYDMLSAEIVIEAKKYAPVKLVIAVPCKGQERYYSFSDKKRYKYIMENADEITVLSEHYYNGCMQVRNRYMVNKADFLVSYCTKTSGGTYYTKSYAEKEGKFVIECSLDKSE